MKSWVLLGKSVTSANINFTQSECVTEIQSGESKNTTISFLIILVFCNDIRGILQYLSD